MNGWRRPHREFVWSDQSPISGSQIASKMRVTIIAAATRAAGKPTTWLKYSRSPDVSVALWTPKAIEPTP